ncbi:MAG: DNRLRE domain-containing protein, partial [bacterium]|nr:DNRLRE domain-containing protein [bacterium]
LLRSALFLALLLLFGCGGDDDPVIPPPPPIPSKTLVSSLDNTLYEDTGGEISNGIGQWMFVGVTKGTPSPGGNPDPPEIRRAVFKFDIASAGIPAGSTIDAVFLTLYLNNPPGGLNGPRWQDLHLLTNSWGEGPSAPLNPNEGKGAQAETNDATWLHRLYPATLWAQPGGDGDYSSTKSSNLRVGDSIGPKTWGSTANMVSDVKLWISTPASNHGWILIAEDESTPQTAKRFATRQRSVTSERPKLVIYYTEP